MADESSEGVDFGPEGEASATQWYVSMRGEVYGPATKAELTQWAAEGRIFPGAQAARVGGADWVPFHLAPGLQDIPLAAPPPPSPTAYSYTTARPQVPQRRLCACPDCAGPVNNVAPTYGWPWGFFQRSLRPEFRCGQCGRRLQFEELTPAARAEVSRAVRGGTIGWFVIVIGLILFIALCFLAAFSAFR